MPGTPASARVGRGRARRGRCGRCEPRQETRSRAVTAPTESALTKGMRTPHETARRRPRPAGPAKPAGPLPAAATALLLGAVGCNTSPPVAASPAEAAPTAAAAPAPTRSTPPPPARRARDATSACVQFAQAAATVDTTTGDLGKARQAAARVLGTPRLEAVFDGAGEGRNREQENWQQHRARVTATAVPVVHDAHHGRAVRGSEQPWFGTPVAVTVTGTARGADGWTVATAPYRLDCLTVQDPVAGWLVDDVAVTVLPPAAAAG